MEKQGVFYAVSVGPGDPELLTRQACRVLADCPVVAAPRMKSGRMLALDIAAGAVDTQGKTILPLDFTMERSEAVREDSYRMAAAAIEAELSAGRDVAMVNLGDVSVYATAYYILERIRKSVVLPTKSENPIFFVSYCTDNDDEIEIVQELLYSNGNNYVRRKQLWYYISGVTAKPKWTEWMSGGAIRILEGDV